MTPLPVNPKVAVLIAEDGSPLRVASNIAPLPELEVQIFKNESAFEEASRGKPFGQTMTLLGPVPTINA